MQILCSIRIEVNLGVAMASGITKSQLAAEMAQKSGTSIKSMLTALDTLATIAYRETQNGFVIPGICKLSAAKRKPRKFRHPITGQLFQIGERLAVTVTPVKKCKMQAVPQQDDIISPVEEELPAPSATASSAPPQTPATPAPSQNANPPAPSAEPASIVLECEHCGNTVAAPAEYEGMLGQCPFCNGEITITETKVHATNTTPTPPAAETPTDAAGGFTGFVTFFCNACEQEIEAPKSMVGAEASCPSCGSPVFVPAENEVRQKPAKDEANADTQSNKPDMSSMTIRIDLSDLA